MIHRSEEKIERERRREERGERSEALDMSAKKINYQSKSLLKLFNEQVRLHLALALDLYRALLLPNKAPPSISEASMASGEGPGIN